MKNTDFIALSVTEGALMLLFIIAILCDVFYWWKAKHAPINANVIRGEQSMNALYVNFGIATLVFTVIVQACEKLKGHQVIFILINYGIWTYLYFFSSWFRNKIFFKLLSRVKQD